MLIERYCKDPGDLPKTVRTRKGNEYTFEPIIDRGRDPRRVAEVTDEDDIQNFLVVSEAYRIAKADGLYPPKAPEQKAKKPESARDLAVSLLKRSAQEIGEKAAKFDIEVLQQAVNIEVTRNKPRPDVIQSIEGAISEKTAEKPSDPGGTGS